MNNFVKAVVISAISVGVIGVAHASGKQMRHGGPFKHFAEIDANADGFITQEEMATHRTARFTEHDTDGDGALTKDEMQAAMTARMAEHEAKSDDKKAHHAKKMQKRLDHMFSRMDENEDGKIEQSEMQVRADHMFAKIDADNDGKISKEEAENMRKHKKKNAG